MFIEIGKQLSSFIPFCLSSTSSLTVITRRHHNINISFETLELSALFLTTLMAIIFISFDMEISS